MAALNSLRLIDYSDRELLLIVVDEATADGWTTAEDVARRLGLATPLPQRNVVSRFSWLRRYGAMERETVTDDKGKPLVTRSGNMKYTQRWRLTARGEQIANGTLSARQQGALDKVDNDSLVVLTRYVAERRRTTDDVAMKLADREWTFSTSPLRLLNGNGNGRR
jgi:hypothetical protein